MRQAVAVFGASGRIGQAQVAELLQAGHRPVAISRSSSFSSLIANQAVEVRSADFDDRGSIEAALTGVDAAFLQYPSFGDFSKKLEQADTFVAAARATGLRRLIFNTTMWTPDAPRCGEPYYDLVRMVEARLLDAGLPVTVVRPVLFMDNLLTNFAKPQIVEEHVYRYCHRPDMLANWISMEDVSRYMIALLDRPDLIGRSFALGGGERLATSEMVSILSEVIGEKIAVQYLPAREFASYIHERLGSSLGPREAFLDFFDSFYTFNNYAPERPFEVDIQALSSELPLDTTTLREWALRQDWTTPNESRLVGSFVG